MVCNPADNPSSPENGFQELNGKRNKERKAIDRAVATLRELQVRSLNFPPWESESNEAQFLPRRHFLKALPMNEHPDRWRELAEQAAKEQDPEKLMELTQQLNAILEENDSRHKKPLEGAAA